MRTLWADEGLGGPAGRQSYVTAMAWGLWHGRKGGDGYFLWGPCRRDDNEVWRWATDNPVSQWALESYGTAQLTILWVWEETKLETLAITAQPPALPYLNCYSDPC